MWRRRSVVATSSRLACLLLTVCALAAACAERRSTLANAPASERRAPELSATLARFVYIEEGTDLVLTVGVRAAGLREEDAFFPLEVSLTNKSKKTWTITRESFRLLDEDGKVYELPTNQELSAGYFKRTFDSKLFDARSFTAGKHAGYRQVESSFFPDPLRGVRGTPDTIPGPAGVAPTSRSLLAIDSVYLPPFHFLEDVLYFPHPEVRLVGRRFSLEVRAQGLEEPARISFRVPEI